MLTQTLPKFKKIVIINLEYTHDQVVKSMLDIKHNKRN